MKGDGGGFEYGEQLFFFIMYSKVERVVIKRSFVKSGGIYVVDMSIKINK